MFRYPDRIELKQKRFGVRLYTVDVNTAAFSKGHKRGHCGVSASVCIPCVSEGEGCNREIGEKLNVAKTGLLNSTAVCCLVE